MFHRVGSRYALAILALAASVGLAGEEATAARLDMAGRCLAAVGYAEASAEGIKGMAAVMRVVHNRVRDKRFPGHPCKVVGQGGQFQAIDERPALRAAVRSPARLNLPRLLAVDSSFERMLMSQAMRLATDPRIARGPDLTKGALYFVNPDMMDPSRCAWFAKLKRTTVVGSHVFLTHYKPGEKRRAPALDCRKVGKGWLVKYGGGAKAVAEAKAQAVGTHDVPVPKPRPPLLTPAPRPILVAQR
jgi:Cell Wall Hydrolase